MRTINEIAKEIKSNWHPVHPSAVQYLDAMFTIENPADYYGCDKGTTILIYFLCNADRWKGEVARRIKKELNEIIKINMK